MAGVSGQLLLLLPRPHLHSKLSLSRWAMSQHSQQNDGPFNTQLQFFPQDSPTIGRTQIQFSPNNSSPVVSESGKRFAKFIIREPLHNVYLHRTLLLGLNARLLPVLYKRALLLHLLPVVSLRQELPFRELASIIIRNSQAHITVLRNNLVRRRNVWTTCWPPRRASTNLKTHPLSPFQSRVILGIWQSERWLCRMLTPHSDIIVLSTIRMVPHEAFLILS